MKQLSNSMKHFSMLFRLRTQALLLSIVPLAIMLALLLVGVLLVQQGQQATKISERSQAVLSESAAVFQSIRSADLALVVYTEKLDPASRQALRRQTQAILQHGSALLVLTRDTPDQYRLAQHFDSMLQNTVALMQRYAAAARIHDTATQRTIQASVLRKNLSNGLVHTHDEFERSERALEVQAMMRFGKQFNGFALLLILLLLVGITLTILVMLWFGVRIVNRLRHLGDNAMRLEQGETPLPLPGNDEIAELDQQYRDMALRMRREHDVAAILQRALLPQRLPPIPGLRVDTAYMPATIDTEVGGDWYDVFELGNGNIGISIGDVAGHGLYAATVMATARQAIRTAARFTPNVEDVLGLTNRLLCDEDETLVTAFFGVLNMQTGMLQYALAGHPPPITVRASGDVELLSSAGLILGCDRNERYKRHEIILEEGSALVLYTDGVVETHRGDYSRGVMNLLEAVNAEYYNSSGNIAEAIHNRIFRSIGPRDDSAVMFIGITELRAIPTGLRKSWSIDAKSVSAARRVKRALLWQIGEYVGEESEVASVELIFGELVGNVARHTSGYAEITLEFVGEEAILHVLDYGERIEVPKLRPDDLDESGRGLFLVQCLARELRIERHAAGNRISAILPITITSHPFSPPAEEQLVDVAG